MSEVSSHPDDQYAAMYDLWHDYNSQVETLSAADPNDPEIEEAAAFRDAIVRSFISVEGARTWLVKEISHSEGVIERNKDRIESVRALGSLGVPLPEFIQDALDDKEDLEKFMGGILRVMRPEEGDSTEATDAAGEAEPEPSEPAPSQTPEPEPTPEPDPEQPGNAAQAETAETDMRGLNELLASAPEVQELIKELVRTGPVNASSEAVSELAAMLCTFDGCNPDSYNSYVFSRYILVPGAPKRGVGAVVARMNRLVEELDYRGFIYPKVNQEHRVMPAAQSIHLPSISIEDTAAADKRIRIEILGQTVEAKTSDETVSLLLPVVEYLGTGTLASVAFDPELEPITAIKSIQQREKASKNLRLAVREQIKAAVYAITENGDFDLEALVKVLDDRAENELAGRKLVRGTFKALVADARQSYVRREIDDYAHGVSDEDAIQYRQLLETVTANHTVRLSHAEAVDAVGLAINSNLRKQFEISEDASDMLLQKAREALGEEGYWPALRARQIHSGRGGFTGAVRHTTGSTPEYSPKSKGVSGAYSGIQLRVDSRASTN